jgi:hypothetical protein
MYHRYTQNVSINCEQLPLPGSVAVIAVYIDVLRNGKLTNTNRE